MLKGILFDKDGTLLEYKPFWTGVAEHAIQVLLHKHGLKEDLVQPLMESVGAHDGISSVFYFGTYLDYAERFNDTLEDAGYKKDALKRDEVAAAFRDCVEYGEILPTCKNLRDVFARFKQRNLKLAVVTTDEPTLTEHCLKALGIREYIDVVYADDGIHPTKPDPYYLYRFCERYQLLPSEIMMVGDTLLDMTFAQNGSAMAVGVAKSEKDKKILKQQADVVYHDVSEILNNLERK